MSGGEIERERGGGGGGRRGRGEEEGERGGGLGRGRERTTVLLVVASGSCALCSVSSVLCVVVRCALYVELCVHVLLCRCVWCV